MSPYGKERDVKCWEANFELSQNANTITGSPTGFENLKITVHGVPGNPDDEISSFIILETEQWSLDPEDIDEFADYLKSLCVKVG
ncbi:MAG: hypothetical protein QXG00_08320 [Candidatus Woesearchaeota archaeon]